MLIADSTAKSMYFPIEMLKNTPFENYFILGILLAIVIGLFSLIVVYLTVIKVKNYPVLLIFQAVLLFIWLTVELLLNIEFYHPIYHIPLYSLAIVVLLIGVKLKKSF